MSTEQQNMTCVEFRRLCGADPMNENPAFLDHQQECMRCAAHYDEMVVFEDMLSRALHIDVPETGYTAEPEPAPQPADVVRGGRMKWFALAATLMVAVGAGYYMFETGGSVQPKELVAHVLHEPDSLVRTSIRTDSAAVDEVVRKVGAEFDIEAALVTYARTCYFRGRFVPHLVVQGQSGPVTIMILPDEEIDEPTRFEEDGFRGTLLPTTRGSIAVIGEMDEPMEAIESKIVKAVEWSI